MGPTRTRYSCTACNRRKIKCNKVIPCDSCLKRGIQASCSRSEQREARAKSTTPEGEAYAADTVNTLLTRIATLEQTVRDQTVSPDDDHRLDIGEVVQPPAPNDTSAATDALALSDVDRGQPHETDLTGAVSVLEFLAWGRNKDQNLHEATAIDRGPRKILPARRNALGLEPFTKLIHTPQLELLQTLLPSREVVYQLVDWHAQYLLWYHGSYNAVVFKKHLDDFYFHCGGNLCQEDVNMLWVALLFSVLAGSMTCSSTAVATSCGFKNDSERSKLSYQWYQATVSCLNLGDYLEVHMLYSVQAISTLTVSAHTIGLSNSQSILLASANRIAQSLGLNRLKQESAFSRTPTESELDSKILRETGRRVWVALCTQDWFSIPFSDSYAISPDGFTTAKPLNCNEGGLVCLSSETPTITSYCNYHYEIAALMPRLQDALAGSNTLYTKYEHVLAFDEKLRRLVTASMPTFLSAQSSVPSEWPVYVPWARRGLAICASHKIIMIHRMFIGLSFTNTLFAITRRTCIAASKTILKEARSATDEQGPLLWIEQAFVVAAAIVLNLDALHRSLDDPQRSEYESLTKDAVDYLQRFKLSMIATRGVKLLSFLREEVSNEAVNTQMPGHTGTNNQPSASQDRHRGNVDMPALLRRMSTKLSATNPANDVAQPQNNLADIFADMFPPQTGFALDDFFDPQLQFTF